MTFSRYTCVILGLYILIVPVVVLIGHIPLSYGFDHRDSAAVLISLVAAIAFLGFVYMHRRAAVQSVKPRAFLVALAYGLLIAIPEEILFRGIIQGWLAVHVSLSVWAVVLAAIIFSAAHLFNRSRNIMALSLFAGLFLGALFAMTGSLLLPTLLHAVFLGVIQRVYWTSSPVREPDRVPDPAAAH